MEKEYALWKLEQDESVGESPAPIIVELAAIPEASPQQASAHRGKRRSESVDEDSLTRAEKQKAVRNEGNNICTDSFLLVHGDLIVSNFNSVGISIG